MKPYGTTKAQIDRAVALYAKGLSLGQIAKRLGNISRQGLWNHFKKRGVPMRDKRGWKGRKREYHYVGMICVPGARK